VQSQSLALIGVAHLDAVLARVAHQLGWLVEAHGLAVEDGGAERSGSAA
jgi:hypothetical protein